MGLGFSIRGRLIKNPVAAASGTFGYAMEYSSLVDLSLIGAIYTKALTLEPKAGNPPPRIAETPSGILNSIGLANPGVKAFIKEKLPFLSSLSAAVIVNIAGGKMEDYFRLVEILEEYGNFFGYEVNLSCPNVKEGCLAFGTDRKNIERITGELRRRTEKPLIIKLTPNVADIASMAKAAEYGGADALSCINTIPGMLIDITKKTPLLGSITGGLSGPAILPAGIAAVYRVSRAVNIPVIGIGGITKPEDAIQYLLAGASGVQIGTGIFIDPSVLSRTVEGIEEYAEKEGLKSISDFHRFI